ncbi:hypothetical protein CJ030_MR5G020703 [Morella rubra]|uniref:EF-hand domain-containing protein n=1 Tax=Morella rubra TaxID=262757 RepID=A0A6A1VN64_9ROSI|nr:hypothetical protein CJ030_MR5G020703 [Morella rubra]
MEKYSYTGVGPSVRSGQKLIYINSNRRLGTLFDISCTKIRASFQNPNQQSRFRPSFRACPVSANQQAASNHRGKMVCELTASCTTSSSSSMPVAETEAEEEREEVCISCTTFNILAPIYKRLDQHEQGLRESDFREFWMTRNQGILDWLLNESSSTIICLQEFWVGNEELVHMYKRNLGDAGYITFDLARPNHRGDGLLTAIHKNYLRVLKYQELLFNDIGDRVAQLFHVESVVPFLQNPKGSIQQEILIVNTHLLFPHDSSFSLVRLRQVYKILLDWNGSKRGHVYKFLRSRGFVSSYDIAHKYSDSDADAHKWISHRNHRGNICGVDFVWLCNPNKSLKPLRASWAEAVFGIIKMSMTTVWNISPLLVADGNCQVIGFLELSTSRAEIFFGFLYLLRKASVAEDDAFAFLKGDNHSDFITCSAFSEALRQVNLIGLPYGLSFQEIKDLWAQADINGDGVVHDEEFKQKLWNLTSSVQPEYLQTNIIEPKVGEDGETVGLKVKNAVLFPPEVEKGMWPENYSLSDHASLSVVFSPVRMLCSESNNHT